MVETTGQFWCECGTCHYRWPICPSPAPVRLFCKAARSAVCPGCGQTGKAIGMLPTMDAGGRPIEYQLGRALRAQDALED